SRRRHTRSKRDWSSDVCSSDLTQDDVFDAMEPVISGVFEEFAKGKPVTRKWPRIPFAEAVRKYGSDKPDLRNPILMQDVSEHFRSEERRVGKECRSRMERDQ